MLALFATSAAIASAAQAVATSTDSHFSAFSLKQKNSVAGGLFWVAAFSFRAQRYVFSDLQDTAIVLFECFILSFIHS